MNNKKALVTAQKKVAHAVSVFDKAVAEVEQANTLLSDSIKADSMQQIAIKNQMANLEAQHIQLETEKQAKGQQIKANEHLIASLKQFTKEGN